jgi:hypothetical protein
LVAGVCEFAVDPRLDATAADLHWLPDVDPRVVRLIRDTTGSAVAATAPAARIERIADNGSYLLFGNTLSPDAAFVLDGEALNRPLMALVPFDMDMPARIDAVLRLWHRLTGHPPPSPPNALPASRRKRLAMTLRAVDARRSGANRREIAEVLFGNGAVPEGVAFDDHHLRSRTARLIRDGLAMIAGGYRKLLKD